GAAGGTAAAAGGAAKPGSATGMAPAAAAGAGGGGSAGSPPHTPIRGALSRKNSVAFKPGVGLGGGVEGGSSSGGAAPDCGSSPGSPVGAGSFRRISAGHLGAQLAGGQLTLMLDGNPLGLTGLRIILDGMEAMSRALLDAADLPPPQPDELAGPPPHLPPAPLHVSIANCNVAPPSDRSSDGGDEVNPFLPSLAVLCRGGGGEGRMFAGKDGAAKKSASRPTTRESSRDIASSGASFTSPASSGPSAGHQALTLQSPHLDLHSPAGVYCLDLSHPATAVLVSYLLRMRAQLAAAVAAGRVAGVALQLVNIQLNGRPARLEQLSALEAWSEGSLLMTVKAPALLATEPPAPLSPLVALWLAGLLGDSVASPLWKLAVVQAAGSVCFFTPWQCVALLAGFDRTTQGAECVSAAQMLYARSAQPLAFWQHVLPRLTPAQQEALRAKVGDLVALDMTRPMGRYTLNLSRQVDRFVALRLQLTSALECSWTT
ncbi:hypothetical protein Agub_g3268, partial [Astrephomene gubernaculifera]